jgi:hypothetical protein
VEVTAMTNTLSYYNNELITDVKIIIEKAPGREVMFVVSKSNFCPGRGAIKGSFSLFSFIFPHFKVLTMNNIVRILF